MVDVYVKGEESEDQQFLYECSSSSSISETADSISQISNLQYKIPTLALSIRTQLLTYHFRESCPKVALVLDRMLSEAESYASKGLVVYKRALSPHILGDHIRTIEKEVNIAHSKGLINDDVLQVFSDKGALRSFYFLELKKKKKKRYIQQLMLYNPETEYIKNLESNSVL